MPVVALAGGAAGTGADPVELEAGALAAVVAAAALLLVAVVVR